LRAVFAYSVDDGKSRQITDGLSDSGNAHFDRNGKYLYFLASTDQGLAPAWLDMSSDAHVTTANVYAAVLNKADASPLTPESDEEKGTADEKKDSADKKESADKKSDAVAVKIDFEGIDQRIVSLPIPARDYRGMDAGKTGILFVREVVQTPGHPPTSTEYRFDLKTRKTEKLLEGISMFELSQNGEKMMYGTGGNYFIVSSAAAPKPGEGKLNLDAMEVRVDPRAEWQQMYREVWRIERDFFYDPGLHGVNLAQARSAYQPYVENIASRNDLNYLFEEMLGELTVGHLYVRGGSMPDVKKVRGGLLGADYKIENGRYRFARV
jgi:tricorn protease